MLLVSHRAVLLRMSPHAASLLWYWNTGLSGRHCWPCVLQIHSLILLQCQIGPLNPTHPFPVDSHFHFYVLSPTAIALSICVPLLSVLTVSLSLPALAKLNSISWPPKICVQTDRDPTAINTARRTRVHLCVWGKFRAPAAFYKVV